MTYIYARLFIFLFFSVSVSFSSELVTSDTMSEKQDIIFIFGTIFLSL